MHSSFRPCLSRTQHGGGQHARMPQGSQMYLVRRCNLDDGLVQLALRRRFSTYVPTDTSWRGPLSYRSQTVPAPS
jgi:hypothetical protein